MGTMSETIDHETGEILSDANSNDAWERHRRIVDLRKGAERTFLQLSKELYWFIEHEQYKELGHPSANSYFGDPEVNIGRATAYRLMGVYETFILKLGCLPGRQPLIEAGYRKLDLIRSHVDDDNVDEWVNKAASLSRSDLRSVVSTKQIHQSESNEWFTPPKYIDAAREVMGGIDTDPASSEQAQGHIQARTYYTVEDDGLQQQWRGRVWLNPPYGGMSGPFVQRLFDERDAGRISQAVVLVNANSTETNWFAPLWNYMLCFTNHRINFISPNGGEKNQSTHGSVFVYIGPNTSAFHSHFSQWGYIVQRVRHVDS